MIPKPLNQIKLADLQALLGVARESKTLKCGDPFITNSLCSALWPKALTLRGRTKAK
jgi:hypothetical protein